MKKVVILGSTGSIGTQTLDVISRHPDKFELVGLSANRKSEMSDEQAKKFRPKHTVFCKRHENPQRALEELASLPDADIIVNAISGIHGLSPTIAALKAGKTVLLANKESLVMAGELLKKLVRQFGGKIFPIDSEASALWQLLEHRDKSSVQLLILTASGGPFRGFTLEQLRHVTPEQALSHPTWKMGEKISIDSATLMNKAFEIIETHWLFDIPAAHIDVVVHRESLVHGLIEWCDGNITALLSAPDMRLPISYALFYPTQPRKAGLGYSHINFSRLQLNFEAPNLSVFPGPTLGREVLAAGGILPAALCIANEIAVEQFLRGEISFLDIYPSITRALERVKNMPISLEALRELHVSLSTAI